MHPGGIQMLHIQMLGTGHAFAKKFFNTNALLYTNDFTLLIDCGFTATLSLHQIGRSIQEIDGILITHLHADHIGGLEEIAFQMKYIHHKKIKLYVPEALVGPLWNHSLQGGLENPLENITKLDDYFQVLSIKESQKVMLSEDLCIELLSSMHVPGKPSYSLFANDILFYSGDTVFNPNTIYHAYDSGCRYIFHDCQLEPPGTIHATLDELLTLPEDIQRHLYLMHYGDQMPQFIGKTGSMQFVTQHKVFQLNG
jgi:ribonuclease BN (tRNA processing enzyme)